MCGARESRVEGHGATRGLRDGSTSRARVCPRGHRWRTIELSKAELIRLRELARLGARMARYGAEGLSPPL